MVNKISIFFWICIILMNKNVSAQRSLSLCPNVLTFDVNNATSNTLFATIHLYSNVILHGIFVDIILDKKAQSVGTFFYEVTTKDSVEFHIEDRNVKLRPGENLDLKFYIKYNSSTKVPFIKEIRLNGQNICKMASVTSTTRTSPLFVLRESTENPSIYENNNYNDRTPQYRVSTTKVPYQERNERRDERTKVPLNAFPSQSSNNEDTINQPNRSPTLRTTTKNPYFAGDLNYVTKASQPIYNTENILQSETCGKIIPKTNPLIVAGYQSYQGQFPWHAALYISTGSELKYICAGSLITKQIIVTAAHCVSIKSTSRPIGTDALLIYLGKYNLRKWTGPEQDVKVSEIIIHPKYDNERFYSDIALVKFKTNAKISDYIRTVCLWNFDSDLKLVINNSGIVPGWGYNEHGLVSEDLSFIEMPIVSHETCIWSDRDFFSRITSNFSYCAGFQNGSSVCNGDSGGGMVFKEKDKWYLRGIVSVSIALQNHFLCDPKHYAVFTDVAKFVPWIKDHL